MLCALSGKDVVEPVVSAVSGKVYERVLIETWLAERGTDPATNTPLSPQQLVRIDLVPANPQITATTSIPALLQGLQTEFNALALENFDLRQQNEQQRAELAESSGRIDAALRVITRLTQERDELRRVLEELDVDTSPAAAAAAALHSPQSDDDTSMGQGNAPAQPDNKKNGSAPPNPASPPATALAEARMDVEENLNVEPVPQLDYTGRDEPHIPHAPQLGPNSDSQQDVASTRKALTAERKQFNAAVARLTFSPPVPRQLSPVSGDALRIYSHWAIVTSGGQDALIDLRSGAAVEVDWGHPIRHMSFLEGTLPHVALLSTRRLAIWDLATGTLVKDSTVQGNPLEAVRHPAGPLVVRFSGKIEMYDADTLAVDKDRALAVPKCLAFAVHPDGEFLIYYSGTPSRSRTLVFYSILRHEEVLAVETEGPVSSIATSLNGYHVAYFDGSDLAILDLRNDDPPIKRQLPSGSVPRQLSFDSTGRRLYVSTANVLLVYMPQGDEWDEQVVDSDVQDAVVAWSGENMQVPVMIGGGVSD